MSFQKVDMKKLIVLLTCAASFAACRTSNGPDASNPAVMPKAGSDFTYQVVGAAGTLQEQATISSILNDTFFAQRRSDTVNGFSTSANEGYALLNSGDLWPIDTCGCDTLPLPIASHETFSGAPHGPWGPTKLNGFVYNITSVIYRTQYEGEASIEAAGTNFLCSQVSETTTIVAQSPVAGGSADTTTITHRYWYSPGLTFFVKDQEFEHSHGGDSTYFTRTLVAYQLAK